MFRNKEKKRQTRTSEGKLKNFLESHTVENTNKKKHIGNTDCKILPRLTYKLNEFQSKL